MGSMFAFKNDILILIYFLSTALVLGARNTSSKDNVNSVIQLKKKKKKAYKFLQTF